MTLTEEQKERMRINREKALEIQKKRLASVSVAVAVAHEREKEQKETTKTDQTLSGKRTIPEDSTEVEEQDCNRIPNKVTKITTSSICTANEDQHEVVVSTNNNNNNMNNNNNINNNDDDDDVGNEEFEIGASKYVTKKEAMSVYCLPEGTIAVCKIVSERNNPKNKGWKPMKLYSRAEIRKRAYLRYGGQSGLIDERTRRQQRQYERNLNLAQDIFK